MQLTSPNWHKVQTLRPYWRRGVNLRIDDNGTNAEYWLVSSSGKRSMRFNQSAWELIGRCDGDRTIDEIWQQTTRELNDQAPTQSETIQILVQTFASGLLECAQAENIEALQQQRETRATKDFRGQFSPTGFRWDWGTPDRLMKWLEPSAKRLIGTPLLVLCALVILFAVSTWLQHGTRFDRAVTQWLAMPHSALLVAFVFLPIKAIHELAHAAVALKFGIRAAQWGVSWILIFPAPFVDLSSAYALSARYQRVLISAAGILTELTIAAMALIVWSWLDPNAQTTWLGQMLLAIWLTAGVSALVFNLNPLAKMDGYHILVDLFSQPNLAQRSQLFWQKRLSNLLSFRARSNQFSEPKVNDLVERSGERWWLIIFSPAAWIWRAVFFYWAFVWLGPINRSLSFLIGALAVFTLIVMPVFNFTKAIMRSAPNRTQRVQRLTVMSGLGLAIMVAVAFIPVPDRAITQGQFWVTESEHAKAQADGFISPNSFESGPANPTRLILLNPELNTLIERTKTRIQSLEQRLLQAQQTDLAQLSVVHAEKLNLETILAEQERQRSELQVSNQTLSAVHWLGQEDLPGQWVKKGQQLGIGANAKPQSVRFLSMAF